MEEALKQAKVGRLHILNEMTQGLGTHRSKLNDNAPKMAHITIPKEKIREVIGAGGKVIRDIIERTGTKIDITDEGKVTISAQNSSSMENAISMINGVTSDPVCGGVYAGKVIKIVDFGAFVNFFGPKEGLVHISEMSTKVITKVTDVMNEGDEIKVKFLGYDNRGRAKLTMKFVS
jgi:polyribonucleotide nucleotidyltransferase